MSESERPKPQGTTLLVLTDAESRLIRSTLETALAHATAVACFNRGIIRGTAKLQQEAKDEQVPFSGAIVCTKCGSLIDYGKPFFRGHDRRCRWCPACTPEAPWRRGKVVDVSTTAKDEQARKRGAK